jgi:hypothetical protein
LRAGASAGLSLVSLAMQEPDLLHDVFDPFETAAVHRRLRTGSTREARTPGVIWVSRRAERCALTFTAPGYELERVVLTREIAQEFLDNIDFLDADSFFIGGFLTGAGFGLDALTGALFEQHPNHVFVSLEPFGELRLEIDEERDEESEEPPR